MWKMELRVSWGISKSAAAYFTALTRTFPQNSQTYIKKENYKVCLHCVIDWAWLSPTSDMGVCVCVCVCLCV